MSVWRLKLFNVCLDIQQLPSSIYVIDCILNGTQPRYRVWTGEEAVIAVSAFLQVPYLKFALSIGR